MFDDEVGNLALLRSGFGSSSSTSALSSLAIGNGPFNNFQYLSYFKQKRTIREKWSVPRIRRFRLARIGLVLQRWPRFAEGWRWPRPVDSFGLGKDSQHSTEKHQLCWSETEDFLNYIHTCIHASMHSCIHTSIHPSIHTYIHTYNIIQYHTISYYIILYYTFF